MKTMLVALLALFALALAVSTLGAQSSTRTPITPGALEDDSISLTGGPAVPADRGTFEISWKHDPDKRPDGTNGPLEPVTVRIALEPNPGESTRTFAERCRRAMNEMLAAFPSNVPGSSTP